MKLLFALLGALPGLALAVAAPPLLSALADTLAWLISSPAGPILLTLAILGQMPRPAPAPAQVVDYTDREFLGFLLANPPREVCYGA